MRFYSFVAFVSFSKLSSADYRHVCGVGSHPFMFRRLLLLLLLLQEKLEYQAVSTTLVDSIALTEHFLIPVKVLLFIQGLI